MILLKDSSLNDEEEIVRLFIENKIAKYTEYHPIYDSTDKGEVKTLAHVATKNLLYFCSHDAKALRIVDDAEKLDTSLENVKTIKLYEIIFCILIGGQINKQQEKALKALYQYQYTLTDYESSNNPEWEELKSKLSALYSNEISIFRNT